MAPTPILKPDSTTILVTGATGYIGSNIIHEALELGYSVRGTVRSEEKAAKTKKLFNNSRYSTCIVTDFGQANQEIDDAVKGVDAIIHVASDTTFGEDPKQVVDSVVKGTNAFLEAANNEPKVKRFVLTSSSTAALIPIPNKDITVTKDSWSDDAVDTAWNKPGTSIGPNPYPFIVYAASKNSGEKALWNFVKEKKPHFVANAILPNANIGRILDSPGATGSLVTGLYQDAKTGFLPPQWYIDVVDDARLHVIAAVLDGGVENERIFAFAEPFNWTKLIDAVVKARPGAKDKLSKLRDENEAKDLSKIPNELGADLLRKWYGQNGYTSLDESVKINLEGLE